MAAHGSGLGALRWRLGHTSGVPYIVRDLVADARESTPQDFAGAIGGYLLVGPVLSADERATWTFETRVTMSGRAGPGTEDFPDHEVYVLKRARRSLFKKSIFLGRASSNDVFIEDESVSKVHAEIRADGELLYIKDLGSANGSGIDGKPLPANKETGLPAGAVLRLGKRQFRVYEPQKFRSLLASLILLPGEIAKLY